MGDQHDQHRVKGQGDGVCRRVHREGMMVWSFTPSGTCTGHSGFNVMVGAVEARRTTYSEEAVWHSAQYSEGRTPTRRQS